MHNYMTYQDIAELTGIPKGTLRVWRTRGKLPEPDYLPEAPAWKRSTIEAWWKNEKNRGDRSI